MVKIRSDDLIDVGTVEQEPIEPKKEEKPHLGKGIPTSLQIFIGLNIIATVLSIPYLFLLSHPLDLLILGALPIVLLIVLIRAVFKRKKYAVPLYFIGNGILGLITLLMLVGFGDQISNFLAKIITTIAGYLFWGFFFYRNRGFFTEEGF